MIPPQFDYVAPATVDEALSALESGGEDAKFLAGGHSLLPLMKLRLAYPSILIDLGRISELRYIREANDALEIGAMTPYAEIERSEVVRQAAPMLAQAAGLVGDAQVRHRGTIGGALAHADPAGDLPTVCMALECTVTVQSPRGRRDVAIDDLFSGLFETSLTADEVIVGVRVSVTGGKQHYEKFRRRMCDWAIVGSAVAVVADGETIRSARVALTNVAATPVRARAVEEALVGGRIDPDSLAAACTHAADDLDPTAEINAPAEYKKHLANVITRRALSAALNLSVRSVA